MFVVLGLSVHALPEDSKGVHFLLGVTGYFTARLLAHIYDSFAVLFLGVGVHAFLLTFVVQGIRHILNMKKHPQNSN